MHFIQHNLIPPIFEKMSFIKNKNIYGISSYHWKMDRKQFVLCCNDTKSMIRYNFDSRHFCCCCRHTTWAQFTVEFCTVHTQASTLSLSLAIHSNIFIHVRLTAMHDKQQPLTFNMLISACQLSSKNQSFNPPPPPPPPTHTHTVFLLFLFIVFTLQNEQQLQ